KWLPPDSSCFKINVAGLSFKDGTGGVGAVIRDRAEESPHLLITEETERKCSHRGFSPPLTVLSSSASTAFTPPPPPPIIDNHQPLQHATSMPQIKIQKTEQEKSVGATIIEKEEGFDPKAMTQVLDSWSPCIVAYGLSSSLSR
ncbi:hypothetical protein CMV_027450, partial [Castanea mollissima]